LFTGLIEEVGRVIRIEVRAEGAEITLSAQLMLTDIHMGDSIAVNGVCLTVVRFGEGWFTVEAVPETLRKTNLGRLTRAHDVHLERAMAATGRFGGHVMSGHVDGVGTVKSVVSDGVARVVTVTVPPALMRYLVTKGSVALDGVSLTVMDIVPGGFRVSLIPHTGQVTRLGQLAVGDTLNIECDILAKYVENMLGRTSGDGNVKSSSLNMTFLSEHGFA
jgi:riboflavin synthase